MKMMSAVLAVLVGLGSPTYAFAHGGGLDAKGCHHDRKRGGYHCHRSKKNIQEPLSVEGFLEASTLRLWP